jgi:hypothetical protein
MKKPLAGLLITTAIFLGWFLDKPFHIDDAFYMRTAQQIRADPTRPYDFLYNWNGTPSPAWLTNIHPPINSYILAAVTAWTGGREMATHAAYLFFPLACIALMFSLACRFCKHPSLPVLATMFCPAFFVSATGVMNDLPLLFFWLLAVRLCVAAADSKNAAVLWAAGFSATFAAMTTFLGLALIPLLSVYWLARRREKTLNLIGLLLPLFAVAAWGIYSLDHAGFFHPLMSLYFSSESAHPPAQTAGAAAAFLGGCLLWSFALIPAAGQLNRAVLLLSILTWGFLWWAMPPGTADSLWPALAAAGVLLTAVALSSATERLDADSLLLVLWFGGILFYAAFINISVNARAILPAVFPAALLAIRWIEEQKNRDSLIQGFRCALIPTACITFFLASADRDMASAQRSFALSVTRQARLQERRVFFIGHWGFQHYMEREGATAIDYRRPQLKSGDILAVSTNNTGTHPLPSEIRKKMHVSARVPFPNQYGIQTTNVPAQSAGFYSSLFSPVPFSFGKNLYHDIFSLEVHQ